MAQLLLPGLLAVVERPDEFGAGVRRRALGIAHSMAVMLATVRGAGGRGVGKSGTTGSVEPLLDAWFPSFLAILRQPTTAHVGLLSSTILYVIALRCGNLLPGAVQSTLDNGLIPPP